MGNCCLLFKMQALILIYLVTSVSADSCFWEGLTWDHTDILDIVAGVESLELCQAHCGQIPDDQCNFFTWNMKEDPHFSQLCHLFRNSSSEVKCEFCISGPRECSCGFPGSCDVMEDNFVGYESGVESEKDCHVLCQEENMCEFYSWFDSTGHPFLNECFLFSSCDSVQEDCVGCYSGPRECGDQTTPVVTETTSTVTHTTPTVTETTPPVTETTPPVTETTPTVTDTTPITTPNSSFPCQVPSPPSNGNWSCQQTAMELTCNLDCLQGYFSSSWSIPSVCSGGVWSVSPETVECEEGVVLLVGGDVSEKSVELYAQGYHERPGFGLLSEKKQHTTDFVFGEIVMCGGGSFTEEQRSCLSLDRVGSWSNHSELSDVRYGHSSFIIQDSLYLLGGYLLHARTSTEWYNTTDNAGWIQQPYLKEELYNGCTVLVTDTQYMTIGGDKAEKKVIRYEAISGAFHEEQELNIGRTGHGCLAIRENGREGVLVVGGYDEENKERLTSTEFFDFYTHSWSEVGHLGVARSGVRLVQVGDTVYAMGGVTAGDVIESTSDVEQLDLSTWTWSTAEDMMVPRSLHSATLIPKTYFE